MAEKSTTQHTLEDAINSTAPARIQELMLKMVQKLPAARLMAEQELLDQWCPNKKRKRYEICKNCHAEYNWVDNGKAACVYHEGRSYLGESKH